MGLSIIVAAFYLLTFSSNYKNNLIGMFLAGILFGVRLSYFPLLILPVFILLYKTKNRLKLILSLGLGVLIWLIPFIFSQGLEPLVAVGLKHTSGHFTDYGGTILTENNLLIRLKYLIHTIWADGLGGFWVGRSWITLIISLIMLVIFSQLFWIKFNLNKALKILIISSLIYLIWIFFFQNLIYKSRHVLPLIFIILVLMSTIILNIKFKSYVIIFPLILSILTFNIVFAHKKGTSIYHLKNYLKNQANSTIISNTLVNFYLKTNGIKANFISVDKMEKREVINRLNDTKKIKIIGDYSSLIENIYQINFDTTFYHNPYMNRMWSEIPLYSAELK
tara:strand:- start:281 stop:1285 length:1005 start_codon:yes stop_codon:yes gene_type:complete